MFLQSKMNLCKLKINFSSIIFNSNHFRIITQKKRINVSLSKHQRFITTEFFTNVVKTVVFKPDILYEFSTEIESRVRANEDETFEEDLFEQFMIEVSLKNIYSVDMILDGKDSVSQSKINSVLNL